MSNRDEILALIERRIADATRKFKASPEYAAFEAEVLETWNHSSNCDRKHPKGTDCPREQDGLMALLDG